MALTLLMLPRDLLAQRLGLLVQRLGLSAMALTMLMHHCSSVALSGISAVKSVSKARWA